MYDKILFSNPLNMLNYIDTIYRVNIRVKETKRKFVYALKRRKRKDGLMFKNDTHLALVCGIDFQHTFEIQIHSSQIYEVL